MVQGTKLLEKDTTIQYGKFYNPISREEREKERETFNNKDNNTFG